MKIENDTRQFQLWNAKTKCYEIALHQVACNFDNPSIAADGRPWRIAKAERPLKPRCVPPRHTSSGRSIQAVQVDYCNWAQARGLASIATYANRFTYLGTFAGEVRRVDPEAYFAVHETIDAPPCAEVELRV